MDETDSPQTPPELLIILAALADEKVRVQTIAPKFTGRFNKGVDYVGNLAQFETEFHDDLAVIRHAIARYGLPRQSQALGPQRLGQVFALPDHSPHPAAVRRGPAPQDRRHDLAGRDHRPGRGRRRWARLCEGNVCPGDRPTSTNFAARTRPSSTSTAAKLPTAATVNGWNSEQFVRALRHVPGDPQFNSSLRQLLHVGFKLAAKAGRRYLDLLEAKRRSRGTQCDGEHLRTAPAATVCRLRIKGFWFLVLVLR